MIYAMMIVSLFLSVIAPLALSAWGALRHTESQMVWYARWSFILSYGVIIVWLGFWSVFGPISRYAVILGMAAGLMVGIRKLRAAPVFACTSKKQWALVSLWVISAIFNLSPIPEVLKARTFEGPAVEMAFPLTGGTFSVFQGGTAKTLNHHAAVSAQRYGLDIVALNRWDTRASGLFPKALVDYEVFGKTVTSPCSGRVVSVEADLPDQAPGEMNADSLLGNHVILHCGEHSVVLAHLAHKSVMVKTAEDVTAGEPLGRVGNTGNTSEPHLHMHVVKGLWEDLPTLAWEAEGVPVTFGGRFLIRGDTERVQKKTL